jgi:predicted transcriptional regulator
MKKTEPITVRLLPSQKQALDEFCEAYSLPRSEVIRDNLAEFLDADDDAKVDAIGREKVRAAEKQAEIQDIIDAGWEDERKASFHGGRITGHFEARMGGSDSYHPDAMDSKADTFRDEARVLWREEPELAEKWVRQVDTWCAWYRAGYRAQKRAQSPDSEVNARNVERSEWFRIGQDLHQLRNDRDEVEQRVREIAENESVPATADDVVEAIASRWSVRPVAVTLLIETLAADGATLTDALTAGGDRLRPPTERPALGLDSEQPDELPEGADPAEQIRQGAETDGGEPDEVEKAEGWSL